MDIGIFCYIVVAVTIVFFISRSWIFIEFDLLIFNAICVTSWELVDMVFYKALNNISVIS